MGMNNIAVFQVLRNTMAMLGTRQKVLARNIANADTPGYVAKDIDQKAFQAVLARSSAGQSSAARLRTTSARHIHGSAGAGSSAKFNIITRADSETTIDGNAVVLEEQVSRVAETRMRYEAAAALYEKSMGLLRMALSRPGR